jgi:hypothetical protein
MSDNDSQEKGDQSASDNDEISVTSSDPDRSRWYTADGEISFEDATSVVTPCQPIVDRVKKYIAATTCEECKKLWEAARTVESLGLVDKFFDPGRTHLRLEELHLDRLAEVEMSRQTLREVCASCKDEACGKIRKSIEALDDEWVKAIEMIETAVEAHISIHTFATTEVALKDGTLGRIGPSTIVEFCTFEDCLGDRSLAHCEGLDGSISGQSDLEWIGINRPYVDKQSSETEEGASAGIPT